MFIAALFIITRTWKQPRWPSAGEWIRELWYIYTMEYYSDIKMNAFESVLVRWMKLEPIIQSEVRQKEKHQYSILTHIYGILEKAMAPHSITLVWKIPWTEEPGMLPSMGSRRVGHDWVTSLSLFTFLHWRRKRQPTPVFLPGESQGRGSLVACRLWGRTESDTTEVTYQQQQHMEFWKMVMMILYVRQQKRHRYKEQTFGLCGRRWGWDDLRD